MIAGSNDFVPQNRLLDLFAIEKIKASIIKISLNDIFIYSQKAFPNECCGFILENGCIHPAHNVIDALFDKSLTSKNSFMIDNESWKNVQLRNSPIIGIYHSHTNGNAEMSLMDKTFLKWTNICYLIVGLTDGHPVDVKLFWWEQQDVKQIDLQF